MEAGKEPRKGSFASVVMIAAIAVLIVLIGLKAGAGMSGTIDKKETLPAMSTEEDLIPVEKYPVNGILTSNKHFGSRQRIRLWHRNQTLKLSRPIWTSSRRKYESIEEK